MPKYWGKQIFSLGSFPKVGQKQKTEEEREKERLKDDNNNGQLRIANATSGGARKDAWAKSNAWREKTEREKEPKGSLQMKIGKSGVGKFNVFFHIIFRFFTGYYSASFVRGYMPPLPLTLQFGTFFRFSENGF